MSDKHKPAGTIRPLAVNDLNAIVAIHLQSFPSFFLTFLGPAFLRLLYDAMVKDTEGIVLVYERERAIQGFVAGVMRQSGFYRRLLQQRKWAFAWAAVGAILRRPCIIPRLWHALKRSEDAAQAAAQACLMSIAILPATEGQGVGRLLVRAFCDELACRHVPAVCLTTDQIDNDRVNRFYIGLEFRIARTFVTPEGRAMNEYLLSLT